MNKNTPEFVYDDRYFMREALKQAREAAVVGEIPVGAVTVCQNKIIAKGYNQTEKLEDVTAHAEMLALTAASNYLGAKFLTDCTLYVTLEPCVMCAGAVFWSRPSRVVIGARDTQRGYTVYNSDVLHPKTEVVFGVLEEECETLLNEFFAELRN